MTSRPLAFETRLATLAQPSAEAPQFVSAFRDREDHPAGRRRRFGHFLAEVTFAGAALGTSFVIPDAAPLSLGALALGLLALAAAAHFGRLTPNSLTRTGSRQLQPA